MCDGAGRHRREGAGSTEAGLWGVPPCRDGETERKNINLGGLWGHLKRNSGSEHSIISKTRVMRNVVLVVSFWALAVVFARLHVPTHDGLGVEKI